MKKKDVNIENVNSKNVNSNNGNCTDKSNQDKGLKDFTNLSRMERYCHLYRVAKRGVDKFKMCANCQCVYCCSKSCQLKGWKLHKTVCDAISQLKVDRKASVCKTGIYNTILPLPEQDQVVLLIGEKCQVACKMNDVTGFA